MKEFLEAVFLGIFAGIVVGAILIATIYFIF